MLFPRSVLAAASPASAKPKDKHPLLPRATSKVDHIVVVMIENRSFDHLLGWYPTADVMQTGLSYPDELDNLHSPSLFLYFGLDRTPGGEVCGMPKSHPPG